MAEQHFDHLHAHFRVRWPKLLAVLAILHLPWAWLIEHGEDPHHPDCTPETAVLEQRM